MAAQAMNVDGKGDEWKELRYNTSSEKFVDGTPITHRGQADCEVKFDLKYDKDFVYFFAQITDDQIESSTDLSTFEQDGLFVVVDASPTDRKCQK